MAAVDAVTGLKLAADDTLIIETTAPEQVYDRLSALILEHGMSAREIAAADESLEAVFGYLTDNRV